MGFLNQNGGELKRVTDHAERLLVERARVKAALATANINISEAESEVEAALSNLAVTEAENSMIVGEQPPADTRAARKRLATGRENVETLRARSAGLETKLTANREALALAQSAIETARAESGAEQLSENRARILDAVTALRAAMQEGLALDQGFNGAGGTFRLWLLQAHFPSCDFSANLLDTANRTAENGPTVAWNQDTRLKELARPPHTLILEQLERELIETKAQQVAA